MARTKASVYAYIVNLTKFRFMLSFSGAAFGTLRGPVAIWRWLAVGMFTPLSSCGSSWLNVVRWLWLVVSWLAVGYALRLACLLSACYTIRDPVLCGQMGRRGVSRVLLAVQSRFAIPV